MARSSVAFVLVLAGLCSCGPDRTLSVPLPDDVDLVAVVFVGPGGTFSSSTPLLRLGSDRALEASLLEGLEDDAYVLGYREDTLARLLPDPSVYTTVSLRPRRNRETGLPFPDVVFIAPPGDGTVRTADPERLPFEVTADWAPDCMGVDVGAPILVDTDCSPIPCSVPEGSTLACNGEVALGCGLGSLTYAFDSVGNLVRAEIREPSNRTACQPLFAEADYVRTECSGFDTTCTLDLFTATEELGIRSQTLQVEDVELRYTSSLRPPYGGFLAGPAPGPDGSAWVVSYEGSAVGRRCGRSRVPTSLLRVGLNPEGAPAVLERSPTEECLRLLRPADDGGFFGMFKEGPWWRWGRFDRQGQPVQSVRVTASSTPSFTPTAVAYVEDRWVVGLSDFRSGSEREAEDGFDTGDPAPAQIVTLQPDASARIRGPLVIPLQAGRGSELYDIVGDSQGAIVLAQDENEVVRLNRSTLDLSLTDTLYRVAARFGVEPEPFGGIMTRAIPEELLFFSLSRTRYGEEPVVDPEGVLHLVRERVPITDRFFFIEPTEPTVLRPWPGRPRSVLVGMHTYDFAFRVGDPPELRSYLARFDLDRPGFAPGAHQVGQGPVTGLIVGEDGQVWGVLGLEGQVFHARLP